MLQMAGGWMGGPMGVRPLDGYPNGLANGLANGLGGLGGMGDYHQLGGNMLNDNGLLNNMGLAGIANGRVNFLEED